MKKWYEKIGAKKHSEAERQHECNFELTTCVRQGKRTVRNNYATCIDYLEKLLEHSQRNEVSKIIDFEISKVIRDENDEIISSTLIIEMDKEIKKVAIDTDSSNDDDCKISGFVEKNNAFYIEADEKFMKSTKLSDLYKEIMSRENRIGLPHINIDFGKEWIVGKIGCSNLGYNFRGRISTNSMPQIERNMTLLEMIYG